MRAFAHGTTVATNALLEGEGARTVLVATAGFEDVVELGRQARADLYRLCKAHPAPLVPRERRVGAAERMGPDGPLQELGDDALRAAVDAVAAAEPEAVAVCLLHAYRHPEHERALGDALAERLEDVHVSLSHEAVGTFREFERAATTEVDAALSPLLRSYLRRLVERAGEAGLPEPAVMQSSGGLASAAHAGAHAALTVLSGPAGGAAGAAWAAEAAGEPDALCFDMGGTSCDVCVILGGSVREAAGREVGGRPVSLPMLDIHTVGAGGGSIGWRDPGGALRAGPRSAGARPGPACYGHGGTEPTVTDANLLLGLLPAGASLGGDITLDRDAAHEAVQDTGRQPRARAARVRGGHPPRRQRRDGARPARDDRRARRGPARARAAVLRRRGRAARRRHRRGARHDADPLPARVRRAGGARARRLRPPPRRPAQRPAGRRGADRRGAGARDGRARRAGARAARRRARPTCA